MGSQEGGLGGWAEQQLQEVWEINSAPTWEQPDTSGRRPDGSRRGLQGPPVPVSDEAPAPGATLTSLPNPAAKQVLIGHLPHRGMCMQLKGGIVWS